MNDKMYPAGALAVSGRGEDGSDACVRALHEEILQFA